MKIKLCTIGIIIGLSFFSITKVSAAGGLTLSPSNFTISTTAPDTSSRSFSITNNEAADVNLRIYAAELLDGSIVEQSENTKWLTINVNQLNLKPSQSSEIKFDLNIPSSTTPNIYHLLVVIELNSVSDGSSPIILKIPYQIDVIVTSSSKAETGNSITSFEVDKKLIFDNNLNFSFNVVNNNDVLVSKPIVYFQIVNPSGNIVYSQIFNETLKQLEGKSVLSESILNPKYKIGNVFDIGQYKAELMVVDSISEKRLVSKITFVAVPYENVAYLAALIVLLLVLYKLIKSKDKFTLITIKPKKLNSNLGKKLIYRRNDNKK